MLLVLHNLFRSIFILIASFLTLLGLLDSPDYKVYKYYKSKYVGNIHSNDNSSSNEEDD